MSGILASQLIARVKADVGDALTTLPRVGQAMAGIGASASASSPRVDLLSQRINIQARELTALEDKLARAVIQYGADSQQAQRLQLSVDKLSLSLSTNKQRLEEATQGSSRLSQIWVGLQREIGAQAVQAIGRLGQALGDQARIGLEAYESNERLSLSLDSLIAREIRTADATKSQAQALAEAAPKAQALLKWNQQLAIDSPFTQEGVAEAFRTAEAYGFVSDSADKTAVTAKRLTQDLVDFAAGSGRTEEATERVALALGQIQAKGRLAGQEVLQLVNAGIPVDQILARAMNTTTAEVVKLREEGLVPADTAIRAIVESLEQDFGGAAKRQAGTVTGLLNSLEDLQRVDLREFLTGTFQAVQPYLQRLVDTLSNPDTQAKIRQFGESLGTTIAGALPDLIAALEGGARAIGDIAQVAVPVFGFLRDNAVPILSALTAATAAHAVVITTEHIPALIAEAAAATAAAAPFVVLGAAIGGVALIYTKTTRDIEEGTRRVLESTEAWRTSSDVLERYAKATDSVRGALKAEADELERARQLQTDRTEQVGRLLTVAGLLDDQIRLHTGLEAGLYDLVAGKGIAALKANQDAIADRGRALDQHRRQQEQLVAAAQSEDAAMLQLVPTNEAVARSHQIAAESAEKLREELEQIGQRGASAAQALADGQRAFAEGEVQRRAELAGRLDQIERESGQRLSDLASQYQEQRAEKTRTFHERLADLQTTYGRAVADAEQQEQERRTAETEKFQEQLAEIARRAAEVGAAFREQQQERTEAFQRREQEQEDAFGRDRADRARQYEEQVAQAQSSARERAEADAQRFREQIEQAEQAHQDRIRDLAQRAADLQQQAADQAASRAADTAQRIADLTQQAADQAADNEQRFNDSRQQRAEDHNDRLGDLQEQLARATTDAERERIQRQIDAENERYQRQEQRAQQAYDRQRQHDQEELARQVARLQEQRAREEREAREKLAREQERLEREQQQEEEAYQHKQQQQQAAYAQEQAERDAALAKQLAQAQAAYAREQQQRKEKYDREREQQQAAYAREQQAAQQKYAKDRAELDQAAADERTAFEKRELQARTHYIHEQAERKTKYDEQVADAQAAYEREEQAAAAHYAKTRADQQQALAERLADARAAFAEQERDAAERYAREQAERKQRLGEMLIDYIRADAQRNDQVRAHQDELISAIERGYGVQQSAAERSFGEAESIISGFAGGSTKDIGAVVSSLERLGQRASDQQGKFDALANDSIEHLGQQLRDRKIDIDTYTEALSRVPSEIRTQLDLELLHSFDSLEDLRLNRNGPPPGRALGGPVSAGMLYEVNEGGAGRREFFRPNVGGQVIPLAAGGGAGNVTINATINITGTNDPLANARAVRDQLLGLRRALGGQALGFDG